MRSLKKRAAESGERAINHSRFAHETRRDEAPLSRIDSVRHSSPPTRTRWSRIGRVIDGFCSNEKKGWGREKKRINIDAETRQLTALRVTADSIAELFTPRYLKLTTIDTLSFRGWPPIEATRRSFWHRCLPPPTPTPTPAPVTEPKNRITVRIKMPRFLRAFKPDPSRHVSD